MEWAKIIVELIGHLAWPAAIVTLVCLFRGQILGLLDPKSVESVEAGPGGVKLNRRKISEHLSAARVAIETDPPPHPGAAPAPPSEHVERMEAIAEIDPPVAVFASAAHFESVLRGRLRELGLLPHDQYRHVPTLSNLLQIARQHGLLTASQAEGAARLNRIRNEIAHEYGRVKVADKQAMEFCRLAWALEDDVRLNQPTPA